MRLLLRGFGWLIGLIGFFLLCAFGLLYAFLPELPVWAQAVGGVGVALAAVSVFLDWGALQNLGKDRTVLRSTFATFSLVLALGIGVAANVIADRYDKRFDLTQDKRFTLSQQSIDIVAKLDREIQILAFFPAGSPPDAAFRALMDSYLEHTTQLKVEHHDIYGDPVLVQQMAITSTSGTVILKSGEATQRLESTFDEEAFTNAVVKITADKQHPVCFVKGHGELDVDDDQTPAGLGIAKVKLEGQNYRVSAISLLEAPPTPETCEVVVLASPQADLLPGELDRLAQYVAAGGGLLALLDPLVAPLTAADMARYGVAVGNDVVVEGDPNRQTRNGPTYILLDPASYDIHPTTAKLSKGATLLGLARSVAKGSDIAGLTVQVVAHASANSWAESGITLPPETWQPDPGTDIVGEVPLVVAVEVTDPAAIRTKTDVAPPAAPVEGVPGAVPATPPLATPPLPEAPAADLPLKAGGHVVVFGDADFASNQLLTFSVNQDMFLNNVAWMVGEEEQLSIRPNEAGKGKLTLDLVSLVLSGLIVLATPALTVIAAIGVYLHRRRL